MPQAGRRYRDRDLERWCGIGIEQPKLEQNIGVLFRTAAAMGLADFLFTIGEAYHKPHSDTIQSWKHMPCWCFNSFKDLFNHKPLGCEIVGIELDQEAEPIEQFVHANRAIYILGGEGVGLSQTTKQSCNRIVKLPSIGISMNTSAAGAVLLYDRYLKLSADQLQQESV